MEAYRRSEKVELDLGVDVVKRHQIQNFKSILDFETHNEIHKTGKLHVNTHTKERN
jgi:hypothetical protein